MLSLTLLKLPKPFNPHQSSALNTLNRACSTSKTLSWNRCAQISSGCYIARCSLWGNQDLQLREGLGRVLRSHAQSFEPHPSLGCHSHQKIEYSPFPSCLVPSIPWLQSTHLEKVSLIAFRQILHYTPCNPIFKKWRPHLILLFVSNRYELPCSVPQFFGENPVNGERILASSKKIAHFQHCKNTLYEIAIFM